MSLADPCFAATSRTREPRASYLVMTLMNRPKSLSLQLLLLFCIASAQGVLAQEVETVVLGRVLLPDGAPAQGASVSAVARMPRSGRRLGSIQWSSSVESDSTGRFSIAYPLDHGLELTLTAAFDDFLPLEWEWEWEGEPRDPAKALPERRFEHAVYLTGSIVGESGELLIDGWDVWALPGDDKNNHLKASLLQIRPDPDTGRFSVGPMAPGTLTVLGVHELGMVTDSARVEVTIDEPAHVLLKTKGTDPLRSVIVVAEASKPSGFSLEGPFTSGLGNPQGCYLFLFDANGQVLAEAESQRLLQSQGWCFQDVPPGEYTVELWHPLFERVRIDDVRPGKVETIQLVGSAILEVDALDSELNRLGDFDVSLRYEIQGDQHLPSALQPIGPTREGGKRFEGIVAGKMAVVVRSPDGEQAVVDLGLVQPNETRRVEARLSATVPLVVQVVDSKGQPIVGATPDFDFRGQAFEEWIDVDVSPTDGDGRCVIEGLAPGLWTILADLEGHGEAALTVKHPLPGTEPVVIQLVPLGAIEGQLRCREGFDFEGIEITVRSEGAPGSRAWNRRPGKDPRIRADGRFRIDDLPVGQANLAVQFSPRSGYSRPKGKRPISRVVDVVGGEQDWVLDLEPLIAASCEVSCTLDGESDQGMRVVLVAEDRLRRSVDEGTIYKLVGSKGSLSEGGLVTFSDLDPAATYGAFAVSGNNDWAAALGKVQAKSYLEPAHLDRTLNLVEREVLLRRAGDGDWAGTEFGWACQGVAPLGAKAKASAESTLALRMPPGKYSLYRTGAKHAKQVAFEWQAGDGLLEIEVPGDE